MKKQRNPAGGCCGLPSHGSEVIAALRGTLPHHEALESVSGFLSMAGNQVRLHILLALTLQDDLCVCDLAELVQISGAAVSAHLQKLKLSGVVRSRREGKRIRYSLVKQAEVKTLAALFTCQGAER